MSRFSDGINPERLKALGIETPKRSKYGAKRTEYNGVLYDSALEARCAAHLDLMLRAGVITSWKRQEAFALPGGIRYVADFYVCYPRGAARVMDAKGVQTPEFKLKRRLFQEQYGPLDVIKTPQEIPTEGLL